MNVVAMYTFFFKTRIYARYFEHYLFKVWSFGKTIRFRKWIDSDACTISLTVEGQCVYPKTIIKTLTVFHFRFLRGYVYKPFESNAKCWKLCFIIAVAQRAVLFILWFLFSSPKALTKTSMRIWSNNGVFVSEHEIFPYQCI